ncbi:Pyridoxal phosphate homeostasis protein [Vitis vinifera]|uniref:Pyridoxal phosphate homeostasis protein n=2 Tax=Vitis vinifera TaxID=29760 RepID=A0A438G5X1_VITVI|nr:Pyridoxal phosphate homeostasis protein [Vitis vinifera]
MLCFSSPSPLFLVNFSKVGYHVWSGCLDRSVSERAQMKRMMVIVPACKMTLARPLRSVIFRVRQTAERSDRRSDQVRVMAVSRTKPVSHIWQVHDVGHRCFGESYVQEMNERAPQLPKDIEWYFIEHLRSNKMKQLLATVLNLAMVEGVNNEKKSFEGFGSSE